jgi:hypothetical protein
MVTGTSGERSTQVVLGRVARGGVAAEQGPGDVQRGQAGLRIDGLVAFEVTGEHVEQRGQRFGDFCVERVRVRRVDTRV